MYDGELGVLHGRAPLIGRLGFGELRIRQGDHVKRFYIDGGFVQVRADVVSVLTDRALRPEQIKVKEASEVLALSLTLAATPEEQEEHLQSAARARAQLRVAQYPAEAPAPA
jgi:F-type H+-transporting ATPase subunit epsilon